MALQVAEVAYELIRRQVASDPDADPEAPEAGKKEVFASWSLFILIMLLILALFTSYLLQTRKIQAVHETVVSIFAGMAVGLVLRLTSNSTILGAVTFDSSFFFNLLLPPIILASGYELHQGNFFRNIGPILTFAFAGTFISAMVLAVIIYFFMMLPIMSDRITFVEALAFGATLSATDPVTILAIFNAYKVDTKLYTIIFGESILNDAVAIVLFETAQKYTAGATKGRLTVVSLFESIGVFLLVFFGSLLIGIVIGIGTSLLLKYTKVRRYPKTESCLILLIAYASYFFANAIYMSGIVSLLFCGICMKHYAYYNMSRRTQLSTKFFFQVTAQLSENFIFIYLGLSLITEKGLVYNPLLILIAIIGICIARYCAVFPLSALINFVARKRVGRLGGRAEHTDEIPRNHQILLFWAGLRGAVGVALAAGLTGPSQLALRATVLVVVVLTVIIFGGTTARMLEILEIRTGVVDEMVSDDEFDIEIVPHSNGSFRKRGDVGSHNSRSLSNGSAIGLGGVRKSQHHNRSRNASRPTAYSTSSVGSSPTVVDSDRSGGERLGLGRRNSSKKSDKPSGLQNSNSGGGGGGGGGTTQPQQHQLSQAERGLLVDPSTFEPSDDDDDDDDIDDAGLDLDLPPAARRSGAPQLAQLDTLEGGMGMGMGMGMGDGGGGGNGSGGNGSGGQVSAGITARGAISQLLNVGTEDAATVFSRLDESFIKPHLLLDPGGSK